MRRRIEQWMHLRWHRAALIQGVLLVAGAVAAALLAWPLGLGVSSLGVLVTYFAGNLLASAWLFEDGEDDGDDEADEFRREPLGALIHDAGNRLAAARRAVGRGAPMYQPLNRLVRTSRKIETRLIEEPALRQRLKHVLHREMPLIATTAEQYAAADASDSGELMHVEGVLREAGERLDAILEAGGKPDAPMIGRLRMDANAEILAESLALDPSLASARAASHRAAHAMRQAAKGDVDVRLASQLRGTADRIERVAAEDDEMTLHLAGTALPALLAAVDALDGSDAATTRMRAALATIAKTMEGVSDA